METEPTAVSLVEFARTIIEEQLEDRATRGAQDDDGGMLAWLELHDRYQDRS
jgi:hypothetical protein